MTTPPEGAQRSEDGHYWWDEGAQTWQPVDDAQPAAAGEAHAAGTESSDGQWPPTGYPADPAEWTPEQLQYWFGSTQDASEDIALSGDAVDVVAIAELENDGTEGTA